MKVPGVRFIPWLVLGLGLVTTVTFYASISNALEKRRKLTFTEEQQRVKDRVEDAIRRQISILHATAGLISADGNVDQTKFSVFAKNLVQDMDTPLPFELGFVRRGPTGTGAVQFVEPIGDGKPGTKPGFEAAEKDAQSALARVLEGNSRASLVRIDPAGNGREASPAVLLFLPVIDRKTGNPVGAVYSSIYAKQVFSELFRDGEDERASARYEGLSIWVGKEDPSNFLFERKLSAPMKRGDTETNHLKGLGIDFVSRLETSENFDTQGVVGPYVMPVGGVVSILLFFMASFLRKSQEESERHANEQRLVAEVGRKTAEGQESDDILREVAHGIAQVFGVICRFDLPTSDGSLRFVSTRKVNADLVAEILKDQPRLTTDPNMVQALKTGETIRYDPLTLVELARQDQIKKLDLGPAVIVPMWVRGRSVGAITVARRIGQSPLSDDSLALLESIAGRMALAIDNARLYDDAQKEIIVRRAAEAEVRRLNESLEEIVAERTRDLEASNQELESFCYSVSHDLRTPLRSLDGFGRALKEDYGDRLDAEGLDFIDRIRSSAKRMDELITALLTLSRLTRREIVPTAVDATEALQDLAHDLDTEKSVEFEIQPGMTAKADPRMFGVVFENLLSNAIKFSSKSENPKIVVSQAEDGTISVKDNGAGFDPRYANKLFQPFERLHSVREFPGHGIGLATVERIVRRHGGEVRAESKPGEGATFFVRFPL